MKKLMLVALSAGAMTMAMEAKDRTVHNPDTTNTETILHVWSWNFPAIASNMKAIHEAGFTMVQTSPVANLWPSSIFWSVAANGEC